MNTAPIRVFVGTSKANRLEEAVLQHTARVHTAGPVEIYRLAGDSGHVEGPEGVHKVSVPPEMREHYVTRFTAMRFAIPELCGFRGRAVYVDSDQLILGDLAELTRLMREEDSFAAVPIAGCFSSKRFRKLVLDGVAAPSELADYFLASVMVFNCEHWRRVTTDSLAAAMRENQFTYSDLIWLGPQFRKTFGLTATPLPPEWNALDTMPPGARIVHFTDLSMQPWVYSHHPLREIWRRWYHAAIANGAITPETLRAQYRLGKVSWGTLRLGLASALGHQGNGFAADPDPLVRAYDLICGFATEMFWEMKFRAVLLARSIR